MNLLSNIPKLPIFTPNNLGDSQWFGKIQTGYFRKYFLLIFFLPNTGKGFSDQKNHKKNSGTAVGYIGENILNSEFIAMITKDNFKKEVTESATLSLVQFKTDWNGASQIVSMIYNDVAKSYTGIANFHTVDFENEMALVNEYGVTEVPTILFFKSGKVIDHIVGLIPKNVLITKIENHLSK